MKWNKLGRKFSCALPVVLAASAYAQDDNVRPVERYKRVAPEVAQEGLTPESFFAQQRELHEWLVSQAPEGADRTGITVTLTDRDRLDLAKPYVPGSMTPMRVGVVKSVRDRLGFARGQSLDARGKKAANSTLAKTPDGGFVWATTIFSPGAVALRVRFEDFSLPQTAEVYIYSAEGEAYGPYVGTGPHGSGEFWSQSVTSSKATVLLRQFGPLDPQAGQALSFRITGVGHVAIDFPRPQAVGDGGVAAFCTFNADCVENNECTSDPAVNDAKFAVAKMRWISGAFIFICSGGLIADTDTSTETPFFLTANHCMDKNKDAQNLEAYFQYFVSCGTSVCAGSFDPAPAPSTFGASVVASGRDGDFTLLELSEPPPTGSIFLGWNNEPVAFTSGAALHRISHPSGAPQAYSQHAVDTDIGECLNTDRGLWIYSDDVVGATEGGSSGSPVVNAAGEIVGQLTGCCPVGGGNCDDVCDPLNHTIDGAFAFYFDQVAPFLDPGTGGCASDADCDDGDPCNGAETCVDGACQSGTEPSCQDGDGCCPAGCDETNDNDCVSCTLGQKGDPCSSDADCCSNKCRGPSGGKTCK